MAPVVHGLERQYEGRIDFLYLHVGEPRNVAAKQRLGFTSTPHFFFVRADGTTAEAMQGVVPADSVRGALERLLATPAAGARQQSRAPSAGPARATRPAASR